MTPRHPPRHEIARRRGVALLVLGAALTASCQRGPAEEAAGPQRVTSEGLAIALEIPADAGVTVEENASRSLRLAYRGDGELAPGTVTYEVTEPAAAGPNLVAAVNAREEELRGLPAGQFFGQGELGSHLGPAYSTRGRFTDESGQTVEEIRIFAVHPDGERLVYLTYRYPPAAGQTPRRMEQAMAALGWVEPVAAATPAEPGGDG
jgi:hypothetical protein